MFKALRDRLKGVSKKLEGEVEKQLGDQIEAELAAAVAKEQAKPVVALPVPAPPAPTPSQPPPVSQISQISQIQQQVQSEKSAQSATGSVAKPTAAGQAKPEDTARPATPTAAPPSPPPSSSVVAPAPAPPQATARPSSSRAAHAPRTGGRKVLSDEEIATRLERELAEAVTVQKDVEATVQTVASASKFTINQEVLDEILWELEIGLLESDVALPVIEAIKGSVKEQLLTLSVGGKRPHDVVEKVLRTAVKRVLRVNPLDFDQFVREKLAAGKRPVVIMFVGVNGTGKTTSIGRVAHRLKEQGISCVMAAGDTFRAGAIEQLALHGERLGITVIKHKAGGDPAAVAYDAIDHAKARKRDVVLLDTAGRMQNNRSLMDEMDKIRRVANPDLCIFVGDSLAGNDAVEQARQFDQVVDVGGVILTKVDVDAKGGAALSVAYTINKPLLFVGVGQNYPDLKPFDADWMVDRLFGGEEEAETAAA